MTNFFNRDIAIVDIETTGLNPRIHEIVELAWYVVSSKTWEIKSSNTLFINPTNLKVADPKALTINGFSEKLWKLNNAVSLVEALDIFQQATKHTIFASYNVSFDWSFIDYNFSKYNLTNFMDYHRLDVMSLAWRALLYTDIKGVSLSKVAQKLNIGQQKNIHRAIDDVDLTYKILKKICRPSLIERILGR